MAKRLTANTVAEVLERSGGLEGGLQKSQRVLEGSFEAADAAPQDEVVGGKAS